MKATIQLLRRRGRRLKRRDTGTSKQLTGTLAMFAVDHRAYGRVMVLQLVEPTNPTSSGHLAALYEPVITALGNNVIVFRGIERVETEDGPVGYAQEWRCEVVGP